jgi:phosphatidylglycerophosphatase B
MVWLIPIEFTACSKNSFWCATAYWLTESAGKYGTLIIVIIAGLLYTVRLESFPGKIKAFAKATITLLLLLAAFAYLNEHVTKKLLRYPRPSHLYVISKAGQHVDLDSMYHLEKEQRQKFLRDLIGRTPVLTDKIDERVLEHWVEEAGYSFPSGHSFNAFLLATILSFSLMYTRFRRFSFVPFLWAVSVGISRVAIGAHSQLDVSAGAFLGIAVGLIFLYFDTTRNIFIRKRQS